MTRLAVILATTGGAGYFPIAPGTVGSAAGVALYWATRTWSPAWQGVLLAGVVLIGTWAATVAARHFQREDPGHVVIDEVAGQLVTFFLLDVGWLGAGLGFLVFRILDIVKPWPARQMESWPGGVGIMADDLMAGIYGWLFMALCIRLAPGVF
jgi:phosphatidylglycerophosphatase A